MAQLTKVYNAMQLVEITRFYPLISIFPLSQMHLLYPRVYLFLLKHNKNLFQTFINFSMYIPFRLTVNSPYYVLN